MTNISSVAFSEKAKVLKVLPENSFHGHITHSILYLRKVMSSTNFNIAFLNLLPSNYWATNYTAEEHLKYLTRHTLCLEIRGHWRRCVRVCMYSNCCNVNQTDAALFSVMIRLWPIPTLSGLSQAYSIYAVFIGGCYWIKNSFKK